LYIVVDPELPTGLACAQAAHAATLAANKWKIGESTYIIICTPPKYQGLNEFLGDHYMSCPEDVYYVEFYEPDLGDQLTAIATLNPPPSFTKRLSLWKGGEKQNGKELGS
jgi:hypothetical protein